MSTPEERLKQLADQLEAQHGIQQQKDQEKAAKARDEQRQTEQEVRKEAQGWLDRAESLVRTTGKRVPVFLTHTSEEPGFELRVGTARVRAVRRAAGWHIVQTKPEDLHIKSGLPVGDMARLRERLVELMVQQGLSDLYEGTVQPAGGDEYRRG